MGELSFWCKNLKHQKLGFVQRLKSHFLRLKPDLRHRIRICILKLIKVGSGSVWRDTNPIRFEIGLIHQTTTAYTLFVNNEFQPGGKRHKIAELGTRQYCRDNMTMFSDHKYVSYCYIIIFVMCVIGILLYLLRPLHPDTETKIFIKLILVPAALLRCPVVSLSLSRS